MVERADSPNGVTQPRSPAPTRLASAMTAGADLWGVYRWLVRDVVREFPFPAASMVALSFAGAVLQWVSALVLLLYVNARVASGATDVSLPVLGQVDLSIGDSGETLIVWGMVASAMVLLAALTGYGAQSLGFAIARRYARRAGGKILSAVQSDPDVLAAVGKDEQHLDAVGTLRATLQREPTYVLRALFLLMRSAYAGAGLVVAGALILLIDPLLTMILLGLGSLFVVPLYLVNRRASRASVEYERANRDAAQYSAWLADLAMHGDRPPASAERLPSRYEESDVVDHRLGALSGIVLTSYRSRYIVTIFTGLAAVVTVFGFALSGTDDVGGWTTALIYLAALLAASASLNAISVTITGASRFLPQIRRYTALMRLSEARGAGEPEQRGGLRARAPQTIAVGPEALDGSLDRLRLERRQPVFVHDRERLDRSTVTGFLERLFGLSKAEAAELRRGVYLCGEPVPCPRPSGARPATMEANGPDDAYVRSAQQALGAGAEIVIFGWRPLSRLDAAARDRLLGEADGALILLVSDGMPGSQPEAAVATVVVDDRGVRGIGDSERHSEWARRLAAEPQRRETVQDGLADDL